MDQILLAEDDRNIRSVHIRRAILKCMRKIIRMEY